MEVLKTKIEQITKFLPLFSFTLLFLGYFHYLFYFGILFSIPIHLYLDVSEILFSFVPIYIEAFIFTVIAITQTNYFTDPNYVIKSKAKLVDIRKFSLIGFTIFCLPIVIFSTLFLFLGHYENFTQTIKHLYPFAGIAIIATFLILPTVITAQILIAKKDDTELSPRSVYLLSLIICFILYIIARDSMSASLAMTDNFPNKVEFKFDNNQIYSNNDSIRIIGETKNYVFFKNRNTSVLTILPLTHLFEKVVKHVSDTTLNDYSGSPKCPPGGCN